MLLIIPLYSCKSDLQKELLKFKQASVVVPLDSELIVFNKDSIDLNSKFKYVIYSDSLDCSSCIINNLYLWEPIIQDCKEKYDDKVSFYFIFSPKSSSVKITKLSISNSNYKFPIIIDSKRLFEKVNHNLPRHRELHTFLLNEYNNVVLVGNPINNQKIRNLLYRILEEQ